MRVILDKNLNAQQFLYEGEKLLASAAWADALEAFSAALRIDPQCFIARLQCGYCHEQLQHIDTAAIEYLRALEQAQATGVWLNPQTTPIEQRALVEHAVRAVRNLRHQSLLNLLEPLRREHGSNALQRVERCIRIYLRLERQNPSDIRQKPSFLYFPDITNSPYYDTDQFTWKHDLEAATDQIRSELVKALAMDSGHEAVFTSTALEAQNLRSLNFKPNWNGYYFFRHGIQRAENHAQCPVTSAQLERLPLTFIREHGPEVLFSVFTADTHLLPHRGVTNTRLVTHLPLIVPQNCALRVAGEAHEWCEGQIVVFDDTYEHEAWNRSDKIRVVLIFDIWHPDLTTVERLAISQLVAAIGDFRQAVQAVNS